MPCFAILFQWFHAGNLVLHKGESLRQKVGDKNHIKGLRIQQLNKHMNSWSMPLLAVTYSFNFPKYTFVSALMTI